ncbi:MAG: UDP-N-acetylglucosamine 1-carboxyvinyltransferase [bacterium]|nr:UDP-N-acetylglucosamine 1-carboxyvinyltransferase [bacterium]MCM1376388.1 UDP-N-acetylglucosamine 1-carboxyvinyltransferase [Muribaculum sp.]
MSAIPEKATGEIHIRGGVRLQGKVKVQGSKNAALPILAATILAQGESCLKDCPKISDVYRMLRLLRSLGGHVRWEGDGVCVSTGSVNTQDMPEDAITGMRSSLCLLGALLARCGRIVMEHPGGCVIGERPIDLHLLALKQMGVRFHKEAGRICGEAPAGLRGADISLQLPSVGATENILLAAVTARGCTRIRGAAREPEVEALCRYLNACGARIDGVGSSCLDIQGVERLHGATYRIPADRIVAGTYLYAALGTRGCILLERAPWQHMHAVIRMAERMGAICQMTEEGLYVQSLGELTPAPVVRTGVYPGFPTDMQSIALAVSTIAQGETRIEEHIFENRFRVAEPLRNMGADIRQLDSGSLIVSGVTRLHGERVKACELRGGAALVVAGLMAEGETVVTGCEYIERGYENICKDLRELGARIYCV